jgi:hypothetical protein
MWRRQIVRVEPARIVVNVVVNTAAEAVRT